MKRPKTTIPSTIHFPPKLKQKLSKEAREQKRSLHQHILFVLEQHAERMESRSVAATT